MRQFRNYCRYSFAIILFPTLTLISSCESDDLISISEIVTTEVSNVTLTSLTTGGTITAIPNAQITARGVVWSKSPNPVLGTAATTEAGTGAGSFQSELTHLTFQTYYIRAYAQADGKTYYGNELVFDHSSIIPKLTSQSQPGTTSQTAIIQTGITYTWSDPILEKGICWGTAAAPSIDKNNKVEVTDPASNFSVTLSNLTLNQTYYARAYVVTSLDVFYGNTLKIFIIPPPVTGQVADLTGKTYKTVTVGGKTWMAENLAVTQYNDGTAIPEMFSVGEFKNTTEGAFAAYDGNVNNAAKYGYLYNGYVVKSNKNVCMTGWRVPNSGDWYQLAAALGGLDMAGGRMKEVSSLWQTPNTAASNDSGFSGLPGGSFCSVCLSNTGVFADVGTDGYWWSRDGGDFFYLTNDRSELRTRNTGVSNDGLSIRCVKN